jgi:hypothetical protein
VCILQDAETFDLLQSLGFKALLNPIVHFGEASQRLGFRAHVHVQSMLFCMLHQARAPLPYKSTEPQKLTGFISLDANPVSILSVPIQTAH